MEKNIIVGNNNYNLRFCRSEGAAGIEGLLSGQSIGGKRIYG
jgi:hypothetical protein